MSQELTQSPDANSAENNAQQAILIRHNGSTPDKLPLSSQVVTIGRDARNDVVLDTEAVSRLHARLECEQGMWYVTDLGSTNGTFLNTEKLPSYAPHTISFGDKLRVGDFRLELYKTGESFGRSGVPTSLISPEFDEDEKKTEEISLARQLFSGVGESLADTVDDDQSTVKAPPPSLEEQAERFAPPINSLSEVLARSSRSRGSRSQPYSFSIWPMVLLQGGQVIVSILNEGNVTRSFNIDVQVGDGVVCDKERISAEVPAGAEHRAAFSVYALSRPLFGDAASYPFSVSVNEDATDQREAKGSVRVEPRFTKAVATFLAVLAVLALFVWLLSQFL